MKKKLLICSVSFALLFTSCGLSRQATSNVNLAQTEVVLSKKNYKIIGTVQGESAQNYIFGIGGLSPKSMADAAVAEMYQNANLIGSQAIINTSVSYKNKIILFYTQSKCIAQGTIIEFIE